MTMGGKNVEGRLSIQVIPLEERGLSLHTVNHDLGQHLVGIRFRDRVIIYQLKPVKEEGKDSFVLKQIQLCLAISRDRMTITSLALSADSNVSIGRKKLTYAFSVLDSPDVHLVSEETESNFREEIFDSDSQIHILKEQSSAITHMAFDGEKGELLASLAEEPICIVWDVVAKRRSCLLILKSPGVAVMWHKSEPYKLLVVEREGCIKFFNVVKCCAILTINTFVKPIISADWSPRNNLMVAVGTYNSTILFNTSKLNSSAGEPFETLHCTRAIKFSTSSNTTFATLNNPKCEIRMFQSNMRKHVEAIRKEDIQSIGWVYGMPYLLALIGKELHIYDTSFL